MDSSIKRIDKNGRIVLGKQYAGSHVSIDASNPNEILLRVVDVVPRDAKGNVTVLTSESFAKLVDYMEASQKETPAFADAQKRYKELISK